MFVSFFGSLFTIKLVAQAAGAVEYTDCFSAEGLPSDSEKSVLDMTLDNLMVRLQ